MWGLFNSLWNLCTVPSGSLGSTEQNENFLSRGAVDGDGDGAEELIGEIDLAREEAVEAKRLEECTVGVLRVSKLSGDTVGFGDLGGTRETGRLEA